MNTNSGNTTGNNPGLSADEQAVKNALDHYLNAEVDKLDFNVTSKLAAARHRALDQPHTYKNAGQTKWSNWQSIAGGGAAMAIAITVGGQLYNPSSDVAIQEVPTVAESGIIEDLPLLVSSDDIEFYQSIEFLEWLENNS